MTRTPAQEHGTAAGTVRSGEPDRARSHSGSGCPVSGTLGIEGLEKAYPGVQALKGVDLAFSPGQVHGLVGENGAGKSTLIKILAGIVKPDAGIITIGGSEVHIRTSKDASAYGLCFIHQELNLVSYFNAIENMFLGRPYPRRFGPFVDWNVLAARARAITDTLQVDIPLDKPVRYLSAVDRAMVAIARAFAVSGSIYFMDEPATALTDIEKEKLFKVIRTLRSQGKAVVYVSHNLDDILSITDRITIMRDGQVVTSAHSGACTKDDLIRGMIGTSLEAAFPPRTGPPPAEIVLQAEHLENSVVRDISFTVRAGEILGIGGLVGSGRTELLETLFGVRPLAGGSIRMKGTLYAPKSPAEAIGKGVVLVPEERRKQGLVLRRSIRENITLMSLSRVSRLGIINQGKVREASAAAGRQVRLKSPDHARHAATLSGGNQQKVVFAKTVMQAPSVLMLDEPSKGVDVGARFEIYSIIRDLAASGTAVIVVSSDFNEMLGLADRILFIQNGRQVFCRNAAGMTEETYLNHCYGRDRS